MGASSSAMLESGWESPSGFSGSMGASSSAMPGTGWGGLSSITQPQPPARMSTAAKAKLAFGEDACFIMKEAKYVIGEDDQGELVLSIEVENQRTKQKKTVMLHQQPVKAVEGAKKILQRTVKEQKWNDERKAKCQHQLNLWFTTLLQNAADQELSQKRKKSEAATEKALRDCRATAEEVDNTQKKRKNETVEDKLRELRVSKLRIEEKEKAARTNKERQTDVKVNELLLKIQEEIHLMTRINPQAENAAKAKDYGVEVELTPVNLEQIETQINENNQKLAVLLKNETQRLEQLQTVQAALKALKKLQ